MIDFSLNPEQLELREEIIDFSRVHLNEDVDGRDERSEFKMELWKKCGEIKLQGLGVPQALGGRGLDPVSMVVALEALGYASRDSGFNFSLAAHLLACVMPIYEFGNEEQRKEWLPSLCNGEGMATNAMTELTSGSNVYKMATSVYKEDDTYTLNGLKSYCSNGPISDTVLTYGMTDPRKGAFGGISCFVLFEKLHNYEKTPAEHKLGLRTCQMGMIEMKDTRVEQKYMLGKPGAGTVIFNRSMEWERICLGALHLGDMDHLLEMTIDFAKKREIGTQGTVGSVQAVTHRLAELKTELESARLMTLKAAWMLKEGKSVIQIAAMAKNVVSCLYKKCCLELAQIWGGASFRGRHDLERSLRHSIGATVYSGTTEVQNNIIASTLGLK